MFECFTCERQFFDFDIQTDEFGGKKAVCPYCKGDIEDMHECKLCGEVYSDDEGASGVCNDCILKHATFENCLEFGERSKTKVTIEVNSFVEYILSSSEFNEILNRVAIEYHSVLPTDIYLIMDFIEQDKGWFAEQILEKEQKK